MTIIISDKPDSDFNDSIDYWKIAIGASKSLPLRMLRTQAFPHTFALRLYLIQMRNRDQNYRQECAGADPDPNPQISRS